MKHDDVARHDANAPRGGGYVLSADLDALVARFRFHGRL